MIIDDPAAGHYYGGDVAAPVFAAVVGPALRLLGVPPDDIDESRSDPFQPVQTLARRAAFEYVEAYRRGGNNELAIYRDADHPLFIAQEFADMVARTSLLPEAA